MALTNAFENLALDSSVQQVKSAIDSLKEPVYQIYTEISGYYTYVGKALPGVSTSSSGWLISRLDETTPNVVLKYADGCGEFNKIWDNRGGYTY